MSALPTSAVAGLLTVAEARRADCWGEAFADPARLWDYLEATSGAVMAAAGACLGAREGGALHGVGAASGLANWLIALPELTAHGRLTLAGTPDYAALAREGLVRLSAAQGALRGASRAARAAALAGWQAEAILTRAAEEPARIAAGHLRLSEFRRRFGLLRAQWAL